MMRKCRRWMGSSSLFLALMGMASLLPAQTYASRPVRLIVPYPPGGAADNTARVLAPRMAGELFQYMTKVSLLHVPYKGGGLVYADLLGGQLQLFFGSIASALPHVQANKLKGIALTSAKRSNSAPQIPTISESGVPGFEIYEWNALYAPAGVAPAIVTRLNSVMNKLLESADVQQRFFQMGADAVPGTPAELGNYVRSEIAKWAKTVKEMGIKGE